MVDRYSILLLVLHLFDEHWKKWIVVLWVLGYQNQYCTYSSAGIVNKRMECLCPPFCFTLAGCLWSSSDRAVFPSQSQAIKFLFSFKKMNTIMNNHYILNDSPSLLNWMSIILHNWIIIFWNSSYKNKIYMIMLPQWPHDYHYT